MKKYIKGADVSSLIEVECCGGRFFDEHGNESDALEILRDNGINLIRLRLWNDPYSEDGISYGAGGCDLECVMKLARRVTELGMGWMLDFHYSDFWADPGKQRLPKAWRGMDAEKLRLAVYEYTRDVLTVLKQEGLSPDIVAVGNELSNGLLWPIGKVPNYENIAAFVSSGIRAVHEVTPESRTMIHLDNGGNNELYRTWFDEYMAWHGEDFDYIGLSYYPFWHGSMDDLRENMSDLAARYGKDMIVAETSMGFSLEDYRGYEGKEPDKLKGMATTYELANKVNYPMTRDGQRDFMKALMQLIDEIPDNRGVGFVYWEAAWLPVPGSGWANDVALSYIEVMGPGGNEWANQALFDYEGHALPALAAIRDYKGKE